MTDEASAATAGASSGRAASGDALTAILGFGPDDLRANQQGHLGPGQRDHLARLQRRAIVAGGLVFWFFALLATGLLFAGQTSDSLVLVGAGALLTLINALLIGTFARQWMRLNSDLRAGQAEQVQGQVERVVRPGQMTAYILRVAGEDFAVRRELFRLVQHERPYILYRAPHSRILLALTPQTPAD